MGILTDTFVLDNRHDLLNCIRRCNIAIRWRVLHRRTLNATYNKIICISVEQATTDPKLEADYAINNTHVVSLILLTSQLELQLKDIFHDLLQRKESIWMNCCANVCTIMPDLANYYKGDQTLTRITRHDGLIDWFSSMANEVHDYRTIGGYTLRSLDDKYSTVFRHSRRWSCMIWLIGMYR
jgi:WASH complex subunit strumpellin